MAHHSSDNPFGDDPERLRQIKKLMLEPALEEVRKELMGPTGRQTQPKLAPHDEGELRYRVGTKKDAAGETKVIIDFGTPVHSIGLDKSQAAELGRLLITRAGFRCTVHID